MEVTRQGNAKLYILRPDYKHQPHGFVYGAIYRGTFIRILRALLFMNIIQHRQALFFAISMGKSCSKVLLPANTALKREKRISILGIKRRKVFASVQSLAERRIRGSCASRKERKRFKKTHINRIASMYKRLQFAIIDNYRLILSFLFNCNSHLNII